MVIGESETEESIARIRMYLLERESCRMNGHLVSREKLLNYDKITLKANVVCSFCAEIYSRPMSKRALEDLAF